MESLQKGELPFGHLQAARQNRIGPGQQALASAQVVELLFPVPLFLRPLWLPQLFVQPEL
jgi:hypothetical protein